MAINYEGPEPGTALAAMEAEDRPSPEVIDDLARNYLRAKAACDQCDDEFKVIEDQLVKLVQAWGAVPANAEKSRRLNGRLAELTVTKSDRITVNAERVETLRDALAANERGAYFSKLFAMQTKYEVVEGAEAALKTEALPKRLAEKVLNLFGRCFTVTPKKPSLKVVVADPAKPAKKSRTKKGCAQ
jgi:hypothetical protein